MIRLALVALLVLATTVGEPGSATRSYLDTALHLLEEHSVESSRADWPTLRARAHRDAAHAQLPRDTYPAIRRVIAALGNPHTFLSASPDGGAPPGTSALPRGRMIGSVAHLTLPWTSSDNGQAYVDAGRQVMLDLVAAHPRGWVVDLRGNGGGDMGPMLTVVAPLLGEGKKGTFIRPDGARRDWGIRDGHVYNGEEVPFPQVKMPVVENAQVAVLVDDTTGSSGEAVLISFTGADNARSFGQPTAGFATANEAFVLPDGALLAITTSAMADRTGRAYGNTPITPNTVVSRRRVLDVAIEWLAEQT